MVDIMKDEQSAFRELSNAIIQRFGHPIGGTFTFTWLIVNWKVPIYLIFGSVPERDRVTLIREVFPSSIVETLLQVFVLPSVITFAYLMLMPWLKEFYVYIVNRHEYRVARSKQRLDEDLREEAEYRQTLKAICSVLKEEIKESKQAFELIENMSKAGIGDSNYDHYIQIERKATQRIAQLDIITKHIENFLEVIAASSQMLINIFLSDGKEMLPFLLEQMPTLQNRKRKNRF